MSELVDSYRQNCLILLEIIDAMLVQSRSKE